MIEHNIKIYENYIEDAGNQKVDLTVFPEATMNYFGMPGKECARKFALKIPSVNKKILPCDFRKYDKVRSYEV